MSPQLAQAITNMLAAVLDEVQNGPRPAQSILDAAVELSGAWVIDPDNSDLMHVNEVDA